MNLSISLLLLYVYNLDLLEAIIERGYLTYGVDLSPDFCFQYLRISPDFNTIYKSKLTRAKWRIEVAAASAVVASTAAASSVTEAVLRYAQPINFSSTI